MVRESRVERRGSKVERRDEGHGGKEGWRRVVRKKEQGGKEEWRKVAKR